MYVKLALGISKLAIISLRNRRFLANNRGSAPQRAPPGVTQGTSALCKWGSRGKEAKPPAPPGTTQRK